MALQRLETHFEIDFKYTLYPAGRCYDCSTWF